MSEMLDVYESTEQPRFLPDHLERIAQRDYVGVNEGYWILRDSATRLRALTAALEAIQAADITEQQFVGQGPALALSHLRLCVRRARDALQASPGQNDCT